MEEKIDHDYTPEIVCPYCGHKQSDSWEYSEESGETYCDRCDMEFSYTRHTIVNYSTEKNCKR